MRAYARRFDADEELWAIAGLVHDMDYERYPGPRDRPPALWRSRSCAAATTPRRSSTPCSPTPTSWASRARACSTRPLFGCDELAGFITACAYVRPEGIHGMKPKSVKKKLKQPSFAAAVNRDDIQVGADELGAESGLSFDEHLQLVIDAMAERAGRARDRAEAGDPEAAG